MCQKDNTLKNNHFTINICTIVFFQKKHMLSKTNSERKKCKNVINRSCTIFIAYRTAVNLIMGTCSLFLIRNSSAWQLNCYPDSFILFCTVVFHADSAVHAE